jgi:uncharacterized RDD family membrane protein YckC
MIRVVSRVGFREDFPGGSIIGLTREIMFVWVVEWGVHV